MCKICYAYYDTSNYMSSVIISSTATPTNKRPESMFRLKPGFHPNATHATQSIALRALRKRKPQETQAFDWLLVLWWLAVSIDHSYWLALACVAFEWKLVLRNVFCLRNFIAFIAFLAHFSYAIDCVACVAFGWKPGFRFQTQDALVMKLIKLDNVRVRVTQCSLPAVHGRAYLD